MDIVYSDYEESIDDTRVYFGANNPAIQKHILGKAIVENPNAEILIKWCPEVESNHRHKDFQSFALPTELSGQSSAQSLEESLSAID